ncbi:IS66 family transposase [Desulfosporosinus nitroreducens]|uniref:IS66 family transposase n=1 Tax=Desulfosporosinus nitroreducens TaxID=2018668 RepID=A0ABT8QX01_9FIRM|nr:IS66 family transposase [Desulfosporosinus nitroreducens]MDO0824401.1 IS66 family transposase [Desulfosporosinus nitroreducens]
MEKLDLKGVPPEITAYISTLEMQLKEQTTQLKEQSKTVESQKVRIDRLMDMLANFQKSLYGQSSEKSKYVFGDTNQLSLFNEAEAESDKKAPEPSKVSISEHTRKAKRTKEELMADLPVVEILCELQEDKLVCGECNGKLRVLGKETVREELEIIPAQIRVLRYIRQSYVCERCEKETGEATIVKAPTPAPVIKRSLASASTVAHVMYQKYVNGMPLYRQERDWANQGVVLSRATLANWIIRAATDWLMPLWEIMKEHLLEQAVVHADETVIQVLKEEGKKPSSESRMWIYCSGNTGKAPVVLFEYQPTRSGEHAKRFLAGFHGILQTDGYSGYNKVLEVTRCGCWSHLRRKYQEAMPKSGTVEGSAAAVGFEYCNQLFTIERDLEQLSPEKRKLQRQEQSLPVLDAYWTWLETVNPLKGSKLAEAITYSINQKASLRTFLEDGRIELSNNRAENAIRPFVVGRRGWLFADTKKGAQASAVVYSIVETAKANKLNTYMYLVHLLSKMPGLDFKTDPSLLEDLTPWSQKLPDYCRNIKH